MVAGNPHTRGNLANIRRIPQTTLVHGKTAATIAELSSLNSSSNFLTLKTGYRHFCTAFRTKKLN